MAASKWIGIRDHQETQQSALGVIGTEAPSDGWRR